VGAMVCLDEVEPWEIATWLLVFLFVALIGFLWTFRYKLRKLYTPPLPIFDDDQVALVERIMSEAVGPLPHVGGTAGADGVGDAGSGVRGNRFEAPASTGRVLLDLSVDPQLIVVERRVGSGCFGDVFQGRFQGTRVAIKSLKNVDESTIHSFRAEALLHSVLHHPNVIFFVGVCWGRGLTGLLLEWAEKGSLMDVMFERKSAGGHRKRRKKRIQNNKGSGVAADGGVGGDGGSGAAGVGPRRRRVGPNGQSSFPEDGPTMDPGPEDWAHTARPTPTKQGAQVKQQWRSAIGSAFGTGALNQGHLNTRGGSLASGSMTATSSTSSVSTADSTSTDGTGGSRDADVERGQRRNGPHGGGDGVEDEAHAELSWQDPLLRMATDVARGMAYLHSKRWFDEAAGRFRECVVHRDLKPDNLLVTPTFSIKITDFGLSRAIDREALMSAVGTPLYAAPELFRSEHYDESCDVYSFGLVLLQLSIDEPLIDYVTREFTKSPFYKPPPPASIEVFGTSTSNRHNAAGSKHHRKGSSGSKRGAHKPPRPKWMDIGRSIVMDHWRPRVFEGAPASVKELIAQCTHKDAYMRPTFPEILEVLETVAVGEVSRQWAPRSHRPSLSELSKVQRFSESAATANTATTTTGGVASAPRTSASAAEGSQTQQQPLPLSEQQGQGGGGGHELSTQRHSLQETYSQSLQRQHAEDTQVRKEEQRRVETSLGRNTDARGAARMAAEARGAVGAAEASIQTARGAGQSQSHLRHSTGGGCGQESKPAASTNQEEAELRQEPPPTPEPRLLPATVEGPTANDESEDPSFLPLKGKEGVKRGRRVGREDPGELNTPDLV